MMRPMLERSGGEDVSPNDLEAVPSTVSFLGACWGPDTPTLESPTEEAALVGEGLAGELFCDRELHLRRLVL
eukprot:9495049-Pyramimonas_sp.AAC.1